MKKNIKNFALMTSVLLLTLACVSGCDKVSYDEVSEDIVVEYAVNTVLNHDKNYIVKLADRAEEETEEATTVWISDSDAQSSDDTPNNSSDSVGGTAAETVSANEAFNLSGFLVEAAGYEVTDRYPEANDGFSMIALDNYQLLILKFNVTNSQDTAAELNMLGQNLSYRCLINGSTAVNVQVTALLNALNTYEGTLEAGETQEMVLVFQISDEISDNINNISLYVANDSKTGVVAIK